MSLFTLFFTFFKIGLFTFGGGYAMIAQIREIILVKNRWLDEDELMKIITVSESTPGPIAINMATYIGYKKRKFAGSLFATLGVVLPSAIIIFVISLFLDEFIACKYVAYAFTGIKCAVALLIIRAGLGLFKSVPKKPVHITLFCIVFLLMIAMEIFSFKFSSIYFILCGGCIGIFLALLLKHKNKANKEEKEK